MGILRTLRKMGTAAVRAAAVLYVTFCAYGSIEICFCDPDPDDCGEHCHDCSGHSDDECRHFAVDVDDILAPQTGVPLPEVDLAFFCAPSPAAGEIPVRPRLRPSSTAPPDGDGTYISYSKRLNPLS